MLPKVICTYLSYDTSCFDTKFMFRILALFYHHQQELGINNRLSIQGNISLKGFLKIALSRVYIEELDSDSTLGF